MRTLGLRLEARGMRVKPRDKAAAPFYLSLEWRGLVARLIELRGRRCQRCGRENCRIFADHIRELADDGAALDPDNVQLLCGSCHTRKTAAARAARLQDGFETLLASPGDFREGGSDLFACYEGFARAMEFRPVSLTLFGRELTKRGSWQVKAASFTD